MTYKGYTNQELITLFRSSNKHNFIEFLNTVKDKPCKENVGSQHNHSCLPNTLKDTTESALELSSLPVTEALLDTAQMELTLQSATGMLLQSQPSGMQSDLSDKPLQLENNSDVQDLSVETRQLSLPMVI